MARDADMPQQPNLNRADIERLLKVMEDDDAPLRGPKDAILELERQGLIRPKAKASKPGVYELTDYGRLTVEAVVPPADILTETIAGLGARWERQFEEASKGLADHFAKAVSERSDAALRSILRKGGISVRFQMTPAQQDIMQATISEQVNLIKSIPAQYLTQVQGAVMRSVQAGRDLAPLAKELEEQYGVTRRRAALIARSQNNIATASMTRARQAELGIKEAIWLHSGGGKKPRPKHVKASGTRYDITKGLPIGDKGQYVFPGEEINCRCVSRSIVKGFT